MDISVGVPAADEGLERKWMLLGISSGLIACITYPLSIFVPMPLPRLTVIVGGSFGPALAVACIALGQILLAKRRAASAALGAYCNALAGALVTGMILVQLAVVQSTAPPIDPELGNVLRRRIWDVILGLDVAFDMFIGLGTVFFGVAMLGDERFGKIVGWAGIAIGLVVIIGFNMATGIWYLVVTIQMIRAYVRAR
jgi:hypothetical protein